MEERIKLIYNDCWKSYKAYLSNHDIMEYCKDTKALEEKYEHKEDIKGLLDWFCVQVDMLHREYTERNKKK